MHLCVLQHTPDEGPGFIRQWAHSHGHDMWVYHPARFGRLPSADVTDFLILLGGPMSPNDTAPWIGEERSLIHTMLEQGKPVFGACFGAQQIAISLGAKVLQAPAKEVGWAPVRNVDPAILALPKELTVFHWHQDMFTLPAGARLLFESRLVRNQAFLYRRNVAGFQFHLEIDPDELREIVCNDAEYPRHGNSLHQTPEEIVAHGVPTGNRQAFDRVLDFLSKHDS